MPDIQAWPPTRYTAPLSADFPSLYDRFSDAVDLIWRTAFGYVLEEWQTATLRAVLELYSEGHPRAGQLRWRQVLISLGRQNGKSEIATALGIVMLLAKVAATIVGIASGVEQANLVYKRVAQAINANPALAKRFIATGTRGIRSESGASYALKPSKSAALQGIPLDLGIVDEVHLLKPEVWADLIAGTGGRPDCLVVGITTAGNDASTLLKRLYAAIPAAVAEPDRFGVFVWEAPSDAIPEDDAEFLDWLKAGNPSLASGRRDPEVAVSDARALPPADILRYLGNRFVTGVAQPYMSLQDWLSRTEDTDQFPNGSPVFVFERTPDWRHGSIVAALKDSDGITHTRLIASLIDPTPDRFVNAALQLRKHRPALFVCDTFVLKDVGAELKRRGMPVRFTSQADAIAAASFLYAGVKRGTLRHAPDPLLALQIPHAIRKTVGAEYRINRTGSHEVDALLATAMGAYVAQTPPARGVLLA